MQINYWNANYIQIKNEDFNIEEQMTMELGYVEKIIEFQQLIFFPIDYSFRNNNINLFLVKKFHIDVD